MHLSGCLLEVKILIKHNSERQFGADSIVYTNYTYRPDGLRHSIGDKVHIWDGANIVANIDGSLVCLLCWESC